MHCPFCQNDDIRVIDSRDTENGKAIRRRRECVRCKQRFTTFERAEGLPLVVSKRSGHREAFDRAKVVSGIAKACKNLRVSDRAIRGICDQVEEVARQKGTEISSEEIGNEVLARLKDLDEVAYLRFASVYQEFQKVAEFEQAIADLGSDVGTRN